MSGVTAAETSSQATTDCPHALRRTLDLYKGLVEVATLINGITDYNGLLTAIMDVARRVIGAEASSLILLNTNTDQLEMVVARDAKGDVVTTKPTVPRQGSIAGWVFENAQSVVVKDAYQDPRFFSGMDMKTGFRTKSILCVPLLHEGALIGVLQVVNAIGKDSFDDGDREAFEAYAQLATTAIEKLRLLEEEKRQARFERELGIATEIQSSFLPRTLPHRSDLAFAAAYHPAREVGGDFYDVFELGPDEVYFVIGDVAGKGVPAALMMAQSLSLLRLIVTLGLDPGEAIARWNNALCERTVRGLFVTASLGRITPSLRCVEIASAGHCAPILVRRDGQSYEPAVSASAPLGIVSGLKFATTTLDLESGDWLAFYTDGLSESHRPGGELLGSEALLTTLRRKIWHPYEIVTALEMTEAMHRGDGPPHDDLTLLAFGFPAPMPAAAGDTSVDGTPETQANANDARFMRLHLSFSSDPRELGEVRRFVRSFLEECGEEIAADHDLLVLGVDEACTNVIRHAYQGAVGKPIQLHLEADELELRFRLRDFAGPLEMDKLQSRDLDQVRPGGLGLHLMKRVFNHVEFKCLGDGTELTLSRLRSSPVQQSIAEPSTVE
jgi:phosphoserine phosphatase RsbU/P